MFKRLKAAFETPFRFPLELGFFSFKFKSEFIIPIFE
jgi:hypothetical protein